VSLKHVLLVLAAFLAGCASAPPHSASASRAAQIATL
jgi:type IV pilus biogenesis protein CpaD/CtpE